MLLNGILDNVTISLFCKMMMLYTGYFLLDTQPHLGPQVQTPVVLQLHDGSIHESSALHPHPVMTHNMPRD